MTEKSVLGAIALWLLSLAIPATVLAQARSKFPVSASSRVLGYAPLWAADKKGFFQREGLDVEVIVTNGTAPSMQALVAESIHATLAANDGVIGLVEKGLDLAIIAAGSKTTHMIIGGKNVKSYEDLRGATLGSSTLTSGTAFLFRRVLKEKGLEYPKDYSLVNVGGSGPALIALSTGKVAAGILSVPLSFRAQELGLNVIGKVSDVFPNYLLSSFSVRRKWAAANRQEVVRFIKALLQSRKWLEENRDAGAQFLAHELKMKPEMARRGLDYYIENRSWDANLEVDLEGLNAVIEIYAEQTDWKGPLPAPDKFVDFSYLQTARRELGWR
ncbi:MAG TPA: ABC transporter substrate-binding protein [Candidatus Binatia bacterium]|nr:ABC transporter substrate-binding protein [Candidatus Binatia bacterium]